MGSMASEKSRDAFSGDGNVTSFPGLASIQSITSAVSSSLLSIRDTEVECKLHPLAAHAPDAAADIKFVRLDFFERLLTDDKWGTVLPRCQDLPDGAFGKLQAKSMLISISHGWFFQTHPDPFGKKRAVLCDIIFTLRRKYPGADILVFFDFLSITQRPYRLGQAQRTEAEQEVFNRVLLQMHNCYCYSDAVIHLHTDPPEDDGEYFFANVDMGQVEVAQVLEMLPPQM